MQCPHCKSKWEVGNTKSQQQLENCPFCGKSLATKKEEVPDTNTLGGVLRSLVLERGTDIYKEENGRNLKAFLSDMAVAFPKERKILNIAIQENIPSKLLNYDNKAEDERQIAMYDCVYQLEEDCGLSKERATEVVNSLAVGLGWETQNNETQTKKTSSSKAKKNKDTSSPVDTVDFSKKKEQQIEISKTVNPEFESCPLNNVPFDESDADSSVPEVNPTPVPVQSQQPIPSASSSGSGQNPIPLNTKANQKGGNVSVFFSLLFVVLFLWVLVTIIQSIKLSNRDNLKSDYSYTPPEPTLVEMYVATDGLNVRSGPNTDYSLVFNVSRNTKLMVDKSTEKNGWVYVEFNGKTGYVNKSYLSKVLQNMVYVEGGTFLMGSSDGLDEEMPVHEVTVSSFYMGKYEVTQEEYQAVMGSNPSKCKGDRRPVEMVTWYDAVEYCNRLSKKERLTPCYSGSGNNITCNWNANGYRLPTEAEWEYAARGGINTDDYIYSGSNDINKVAWYYENSGEITHDVGIKKANSLGIYDMTGNVYEWCWDWYDEAYYSKSPRNNPIGATSGSYRVKRGGSWYSFVSLCLVSDRYDSDPNNRGYYLGFRVVRSSSN